MSAHGPMTVPLWSLIAPVLACGVLSAIWAGIVPDDGSVFLIGAATLLGAVAFSAVIMPKRWHLRLGEPFGSILLAVAVTVIEVALIVSILLSDTANRDTVARDTVFAKGMIVLNGVIGLCLMMGGRRHHEQKCKNAFRKV